MAAYSIRNSVHSRNIISSRSKPQIWVICTVAYHLGKLHGVWLDATQPVESLSQQIQLMLLASPVCNAISFAIHDYDYFGSLQLEEYEDLEEVHHKAMIVHLHGELGIAVVEYYKSGCKARYAMEHLYCGQYETPLEFAIEEFDARHMNNIPEELQCYMNYASYEREIFIDKFILLNVNGQNHVFAHKELDRR